jgi:hypothetical protein
MELFKPVSAQQFHCQQADLEVLVDLTACVWISIFSKSFR